MNAETLRVQEFRETSTPWKNWGPYLSEPHWGTVREDYSEGGNAWDYFTDDQTRSRAYHWGEDGLAGISDQKQRLCFALALWNSRDPIVKERLFGLTNSEGNLGEDVKEYYFYVDSTPTHSGDVNPPVHAWATIFTFRLEQAHTGKGDKAWLQRCFQKLLLNFTWWVNRKDRMGKNVFEGGFLGLDNIGVFDRSSPLPTGGYLEQADGTAWMAIYCQNMLEIAIELSLDDSGFEDMALKFVRHFLWIAAAMVHAGDDTGMWDEEDGFFYDVLRLPDGTSQRLKVRSMVGLLPLCAATAFEGEVFIKYPEVAKRLKDFLDARPELFTFIHDPRQPGCANRRLGSILNEGKLRRVLSKMLDENELLSPYGLRALSRYHAEHPYVFHVKDQEYRVSYLPAESDSGMFGGNSAHGNRPAVSRITSKRRESRAVTLRSEVIFKPRPFGIKAF